MPSWSEFDIGIPLAAKQVFPKVAAGFGSKNLLDKGS
jgi:hypothetical protein